MTRIKSALEIAMEKMNKTDKLTPEEKEKIKAKEKIKSLLAKYYKGQITSNDLWQKLKGDKLSTLREAQSILIHSLSAENSIDEYHTRKDAILAIETLKENQDISSIESTLNEINLLKKEYQKKKEEVGNTLKKEIEKNPKARIKTIRHGDKLAMIQLSVEEALQENPQWKNFIAKHEEEYNKNFKSTVKKLMNII